MTNDPTTDRYRCAEEADAAQWTGSNDDQLRAFCGSNFDTIDPEDRVEDPDETAAVRAHPHGGWFGLKPGDWVVKHADHFSVASDEEFRERWTPVPAPSVPTTQTAELRGVADYLHQRGVEAGDGGLTGAADLLRRLAAVPAAVEEQPDTGTPETEPEFTEARAAFMQIGRTPSLEGLRAELQIEGWPPIIGRYCGASMGRMHDVPGHEHLLAVDPRLIFEYADEQPAAVAQPGKET